MSSAIKLAQHGASVLLLTFATMPCVLCQRANPNDRSRDHDLRGSDFDLRMLEKEKSPAARQASRLSFAQAADDFLHLQVANNKLMQTVVRGEALDLTFVAKSVSEIKKYAERLKANLVLPEANGSNRLEREIVSDVAKLRSTLSELGELVAEFRDNPVFKGKHAADIVDVELSTKARLDLKEIIELSDHLKKSVQKMGKGAKRSQ